MLINKFDPQARYYTEQLNQESELLHAKIEKLTKEKAELRSQIVIQDQMDLREKDYESIEIKALKDEIEELKANMDRKEYLLQYVEQRNTEFEKLNKKRAGHDEYIKRRLEGLSIEADKERTITNVVEDCTRLQEENERLRRENKSLQEQLDYELTNTHKNKGKELEIFQNNMKPLPKADELVRIKGEARSREAYVHKLEQRFNEFVDISNKFKEDLTNANSEVNMLSDRIVYLEDLNSQLKKAVSKYKVKCEEYESKINDHGVKVWVKEDAGIQRVTAADIMKQQKLEEDQSDSDGSQNDDDNEVNEESKEKKPPKPKTAQNNEEKVIDEFDVNLDNSFEGNQKNGKNEMDNHFPDFSEIVVNPDALDHHDDDDHDAI